MSQITIAVLTVSDRCANLEADDRSGPTITRLIEQGIIENGKVVDSRLVPDSREDIQEVLRQWCDKDINLILTTGGTGLSERDVTPEATAELLDRTVPGISDLVFKHSSQITPLAALSRGLAGVRGKSLIVNFPGSPKGCKECLEAIAGVIPHAVDLIRGRKEQVELMHSPLKKSSVVTNRVADRPRISEYPMVKVEDAQNMLLDIATTLLEVEVVDYKDAHGFVISEDVVAKEDHPSLDVSLRDGYAVRSGDRMETRTVKGVTCIGRKPPENLTVKDGTCVRVSTGGCIPSGANAVVEVEKTTLMSLVENASEERSIKLKSFPKEMENIRKKGSDYKKGEVLLKGWTCLNAAALGILASAGNVKVSVFSKPKVAVMSTGDELIDVHEELELGKFRDSNRILLTSLIEKEGFKVKDLGIVRDEPDSLRDSLEEGFRSADVVVTTGSMSMGERDYLKEVISADFGGKILFGRVDVKPGKPTCVATVIFEGKMKIWFGLPGNPASAFVTSHLFVLPTLKQISGRREGVLPKKIAVTVASGSVSSDCRPQYVRSIVNYSNGRFSAQILEQQRSSWIKSCLQANALVLCPKNVGISPPTSSSNYGTNSCYQKTEYSAFMIGEMVFSP